MSRTQKIARRRFLKGVAVSGATVTVGLPLLRMALNDHGDALASGEPIPTYFGVWFWGNGMRPSRWIPSSIGSGNAWSLSSELAPLAAVKEYLSVVTNTLVTVDRNPNTDNPHAVGAAGMLTGDNILTLKPGTMEYTVRQRSIDQIAADQLSQGVARRSLEVALCPQSASQFGGTVWDHISHNGPNAPNPAEGDLRALFYRLFSNAQELYANDARLSVLDVVQEQTRELQRTLGAEDRRRLDQHLEGIRSVEKVIESSAYCTLPPAPNNVQILNGSSAAITERSRISSQIIALALSCGITRVFSMQSNRPAGDPIVDRVAAGQMGVHYITHEQSPQYYDVELHNAVLFFMEQLAVLLNTLKNTPVGAGNMLEHSVLYCTSDLSDASDHTLDEMPVLIAGKGGGRLRGNVHHRFAARTTGSTAALTALQGAGVNVSSFGVGGAYTTSSIAELKT